MLSKNSGLSLLEVMIAGIILVTVVSLFTVTYVSFSSKLPSYDYYYTAINLARDCVEFGESGRFLQPFRLVYSYDAGRSARSGRGARTPGYRLTEWSRNFDPAAPDPFDYIGDIGPASPGGSGKGLVPRECPYSVKIIYEVIPWQVPLTGRLYLNRARVDWLEKLPGCPEGTPCQEGRRLVGKRDVELAVTPITHYNDQLHLITGKFWWEKR